MRDGDSVTVLDASRNQHKVRIDGIDAPELGQPFGRAAKNSLSNLIGGADVVATCSKVDHYGRDVCRVMLHQQDVGLAQLQAGMGWFFRRYARELPPEVREQYAGAEQAAREAGKGLWADPAPSPPWAWRRSRSRAHQHH